MQPLNNSSGVGVDSNVGMRPEDSLKDNNTSSNVQAQMLFIALRSVIIPIVQAAVPNCPDLRELPLESEALNFLAMLQKYMTSIICDLPQSDGRNRIKQTVNLGVNSTNQELDKTGPSLQESHEISPGTVLSPHQHSEDNTPILTPFKSNETSYVNGAVSSQEKRPKRSKPFIHRSLPIPPGDSVAEEHFNKALSDLRAYVFNDMPMRLLCFEKRGSELDITLLDRAGTYSHLVPKLKNALKARYNTADLLRVGGNPVTETASYAILSHTWLRSASGEVTYDDWHNFKGALDLTHPGHQKLINFCRMAAEKHGLTLGWMDTICINKASSAELDESIRSMYKWYEKAKVCITYLAETTTLSEMAKDPWFTRGWTLQELLAPQYIMFYDANWGTIGHYFRQLPSTDAATSKGLQEEIELATTINPKELKDPRRVSISRKMQWAANREVTREEDTAYSLMGIFDVNMSIAYGEGGQVAFVRLIKEIMSSAKLDVVDIFNSGRAIYNHRSASTVSALLPSSPKAYLQRSTLKFWGHMLLEPLTLTHLGLRIPVLLLRASATFNAHSEAFTPIGDYYATITLTLCLPTILNFKSYNILDIQNSPAILGGPLRPRMVAFGILNCGGDESGIYIPETCLAIAILYNDSENMVTITPMISRSYAQIATEEPIVFSLKDGRAPQNLTHSIERTQLARHGMRLLTMYL